MKTGQLRERVTIEQYSTASDGAGGKTKTWTVKGTVWANVTPKRAGEREVSDRLSTSVEYEVSVRYDATITPQMRVKWTPYQGSEKELTIKSVVNFDQKRKYMVLICEEGRKG